MIQPGYPDRKNTPFLSLPKDGADVSHVTVLSFFSLLIFRWRQQSGSDVVVVADCSGSKPGTKALHGATLQCIIREMYSFLEYVT